MSLFISSNSTNALIAKTESLEKKFNELGEQKKSTNSSFIRNIKSFRNSSSARLLGIRRKPPKIKSIKTFEKELNKAKALQDKLYKHYLNLSAKQFKKDDKNGGQGQDKLKQLQSIRKKTASQKRLIQKIDSDLRKSADIKIRKETSKTLLDQLGKKIGLINSNIKFGGAVEQLTRTIQVSPNIINIRGFQTPESYVESFRPKQDNKQSGVNGSGDLIEL